MPVVRAVIGAVILFLGRELNFLFAAAMAGLIAFRLTPLLPTQWPGWYDYIFIGVLAIIAAVIPIRNERVGYFVSGFLAGSYFFIDSYAPGVLTVPLVPFLAGGIFGSVIMGIFTEWALIVVSCLFGAYYISNLFILSRTAKILVTSGLFIIGAITQVVMRRQRDD